MTQEQLEALLAQIAPNGQPIRLEHSTATKKKKVTRPPTTRGGNPTEEEVNVTEHSWIDRGTGRVLTAEVNDDGTYTVTFNGIKQSEQGNPSVTAAQQQAEADQVGKPTGNARQRTEGNRTVKETEYLLPNGTTVWRTQEQTDAPQAADQVGKPTGNSRQRTEGNKTVKETEYVLPDGTTQWRSQEQTDAPTRHVTLTQDGTQAVITDDQGNVTTKPTGLTAPPKPGQVVRGIGRNGEDMQAVADPQTGRISYQPIEGAPQPARAGALPPGMARPQFTPGQVSAGLRQARQQLDIWIQDAPDEATRDARKKEATQMMAEEHAAATAYLNEQATESRTAADVYGTQVSQRGQDVSMANTRTSAGASMANQAVGTFLPLLRYAQAGSGDPAKALAELMAMGRENVAQMGGLVNPPPIGVPAMLQRYAGQSGQPGVAPTQPQPSRPAPQAAPAVTIHVSPNGVTDTTDQGGVPRVYTPSSNTTPQMPDIPPVALGQFLDQVEQQMAQDPQWGIDDLALIQQGVSPLG